MRAFPPRGGTDTPEEALKLLTSVQGYRCHFGDRVHTEAHGILND
jgi:hypothetical protein